MGDAMASSIGNSIAWSIVDVVVSSMVDSEDGAMALSMVESMPSSNAYAMASSMDPSMASSMVGVDGAVHGRRHGPPSMDDAIAWNAPRVPMAYSMGGHHGSCLLYTSPSPRDGLLSRMPSSA